MGGILLKLRTWWETADRTQRSVTLIGGGFLLLLLLGTYYFASKPKMEMAFGGLSPAEQGNVVEEIQKMGVPVEFDLSGNVLVPSAKVSEVKMRLATAGKLPSASHWGYGDLEKFNMMSTPKVEQERLKSIMEGELAKTIESLDSVQNARVLITLGSDSPFATEKLPPTASVTISPKGDFGVTRESAKSIARLVANAVPGLDTKHVTVVDKNLQPIWLGDDETGAHGLASERLQSEVVEAKRRERELQQKLDYFFGPGATMVTVDLRLNFDTETENRTEPILSKVPVVEAKEKMAKGVSDEAAEGIAGTGSNVPDGAPTAPPTTPPATTNSSEPGYVNQTKEYAVGERKTQTAKSPGDVRSMSITVLVDKNKVEDSAAVGNYVKGYLGPKATDTENFSATITEVERKPDLDKAAQEAVAGSQGRERLQQVFSLLPVLALLIVGFIVVKSIAKAAKAQNVLVAALPGGRMMPMALPEPNADPKVEMIEARPAPALEAPFEDDDYPEITTKVNKPLEQIKKMTGDRPDVVAMLIKSWLLEDTR